MGLSGAPLGPTLAAPGDFGHQNDPQSLHFGFIWVRILDTKMQSVPRIVPDRPGSAAQPLGFKIFIINTPYSLYSLYSLNLIFTIYWVAPRNLCVVGNPF